MAFSNKIPAMNQDEIENYWDTLCSFTGEDPQKEAQILSDKILYPNYLFRYRSVNNNNLEALRTNKIYLSQASNMMTHLILICKLILIEFVMNLKKIINLFSELKIYLQY